tara:strand:+ start:74 stop:535 length:462 start_codon:yes stop_codon:yes gene_type:complete
MKNKTRVFLENYISIFENLSEKNYHQLENALTSDVIFEDPFNKIKGKDDFIEIFREMFKKLDNPFFKVTDYFISENTDNKHIGYLKWVLKGNFRNKNKKISITGMSEVSFDIQGKVIYHIDYWDSLTQLIVELPYIGKFIKKILKIVFKFNNI